LSPAYPATTRSPNSAPSPPARPPRPSPVVVADGAPLPQPYALADLFLLPSHSENFGQAIAEALAAGVPALVTDTLPWRELDSAGAGRCVAWTDYPAALDALLASPREELVALGATARDWVLANFSWRSSARRLLDFYPTLRVHAS
jgi:Glycosyltransferase